MDVNLTKATAFLLVLVSTGALASSKDFSHYQNELDNKIELCDKTKKTIGKDNQIEIKKLLSDYNIKNKSRALHYLHVRAENNCLQPELSNYSKATRWYATQEKADKAQLKLAQSFLTQVDKIYINSEIDFKTTPKPLQEALLQFTPLQTPFNFIALSEGLKELR